MVSTVELHGVNLTPVIELEPGTFSTQPHSSPSGSVKEMPNEWEQYWRACLADSGIAAISPIFPGSWHIATTELSSSQLEKYLRVVFDGWGGVSILDDPDSRPVLNGGLALSSDDFGVICEPTCCSDLGDIANWKEAATYEGSEWAVLWIGHPHLSMKFRKPWLLLSDLHEFDAPVERWAVKPNEIGDAVMVAEAELSRFSKQIASILTGWKYEGDSACVSQKLVGLFTE
jgi:hypothetical protein